MIYLVLLVLFIIVVIFLVSSRKPPNFPPGPWWYPITGTFHEVKNLAKKLGGQHLAFAKLSKDYNSNVIGLKMGEENLVIVSSYELIKDIAHKHEYNGRPNNFFLRMRSMGTRKGIAGADGELWKIQRNFVVTHLRTLGFGLKPMDDMVREEVYDVLSMIKDTKGKETKIVPILSVAVLNVLWKLLTGSRLDKNDERLNKLLILLDKRALAFNMAGGVLNHFPWLRFLAPEKSGYNLIMRLNLELKEFLMSAINDHYSTWETDKKDDLIYSFITEMRKSKNGDTTFTEDQLMMMCLDIFIAGSQTTSNTLDFSFLMMILYPDVQEKLRKCINDAFDPSEEVTFSCRLRVPYVEAVLCEVQRYCHVIPISGPKRVTKDVRLGGYDIPKNTTMLLSFYSINQDESYWKDPDVFRPERFLDESGKLNVPERFQPYGVGLRRCIGEILARTSIFTFFSEILRNYRVETAVGAETPSELFVAGITLLPREYRARFTPINEKTN